MKKPPFKLAVASLFLENQTLGPEDVYEKLVSDYPNSPLCALSNIEQSLQSLSAVGILQHTGKSDGNFFALTEHGRRKVLWAVGPQ